MAKAKPESKFQASVIKKIQERYPGCIVVKNDPGYLQGFPDFTVFYNNVWVALEFKKSENAAHQPNQDYYVRKCEEMSHGYFIYPENEQEVMNEIQQAFGA